MHHAVVSQADGSMTVAFWFSRCPGSEGRAKAKTNAVRPVQRSSSGVILDSSPGGIFDTGKLDNVHCIQYDSGVLSSLLILSYHSGTRPAGCMTAMKSVDVHPRP